MPASLSNVPWRGRRACPCLVNYVAAVERDLGYKLTIYQGSFSSSVGASAGTHSGGGALDDANYSDRELRVKRQYGGASWHRTPAQGFIHHSHTIIAGCPHVSRDAAFQVSEYKYGRNGLAGRGRDDGPRVGFVTWPVAARRVASLSPLTSKPLPKTMKINGKTYPAVNVVSVYWINANRANGGRYVNRHVARMQGWLMVTGHYKSKRDGHFGPKTQAALNAFRRSLGWRGTDITGPVGIRSLTLLRDRAHSKLSVKKGK